MRVNSSKRNSKEDILRNVSTTPSFQKLQEKILTLQKQNNEGETIQSSLSMSCNNRTTQSNRYIGFDRCRDQENNHQEFNSCSNIDSYMKQHQTTDHKYSSNNNESSLQKLYDPLKQEQQQQQTTLKPPRYHTPTRDKSQSNDLAKSKNGNRTDSKKQSSKSLKRSVNNSKSKGCQNVKGEIHTNETSPLGGQRKASDSSANKSKKASKIQENEQEQTASVSEKDKKIIQNLQKKLQNKSPISKSFKENRAGIGGGRVLSTVEGSQNSQNQVDTQNAIDIKTAIPNQYNHRYLQNYLSSNSETESKQKNAKILYDNNSLNDEYETDIQQNFLSNLKEKLDEENQIINEQVQKIDKKIVPSQASASSSNTSSCQNSGYKQRQHSLLQLNAQMEMQQSLQPSCQSSSNLSQLSTQQKFYKQNQQIQLDKFTSNHPIHDQKYFGQSSISSTSRKSNFTPVNSNKDLCSSESVSSEYRKNSYNSDNSNKQHNILRQKLQNGKEYLKDLSNSSSAESLRKQKVLMNEKKKQYILEDLAKTTDTRATSCKSNKQTSVPIIQEKDLYNRFSTEDKSYDNIHSADDELFSSYSLASKSNKNSQFVKNQLSQQRTPVRKQDDFNSLYQPNQCSNKKLYHNEKENIVLDFKKFDFSNQDQKKMEISALCSTTRQCVNGNQEQIQDLKAQIAKLQQENATLKNLIKKQESQSYLEKQENGQNSLKVEQLSQKNEAFQAKIKQYEEVIQIQKTNSAKSTQEIQNKFLDQIDKLQSNFNEKQNEAIHLKNELTCIQQLVDAQMEKTNTQSIKIKNLEQLVSEYSKIESKLFELEDEHEIIKKENENLKEKLKECQGFEQRVYQLMADIKKSAQQQKSKVVEFGQVIDAYLKLNECIITEAEPSLDVLVGHRRKRSSFLEIKKQDDNIVALLDNENVQQKIKEQSELIIAYAKGSSERIQSILDSSRTLLDKLSDYYMLKFGNGIL